jgi:hypothetical protein
MELSRAPIRCGPSSGPSSETVKLDAPLAMIDASSAILLTKAGAMEACCQVFRIKMTRRVFEEVTVVNRPGERRLRALAGKASGFVVVEDPTGTFPDQAAADLQRLHQGERDTLHHFLNGAARFVVLDDGKGVQVCRRHGIPHINALLCPKILHYSERLPDAKQVRCLFGRIAGLGRYSKDVVAWAQQCRRSDLEFFLSR